MAEQATERTTIAAPPDVVYATALDIEAYPEWAQDIKEVTIVERDDDDRPLRVRFRAAAMGHSARYVLKYDHSGAPRSLKWVLEQEGFGIVFLEAAAAGAPCVAGASGGVRDAVEHGVTGLVVDRPRDVAAVAKTLARLVDDADERRRMGATARARAVASFSYDGLAAQLWSALQGLS